MKRIVILIAALSLAACATTPGNLGQSIQTDVHSLASTVANQVTAGADPLAWLANLAPADIASMRANAAADKTLVDPTTGINMGVNCADHLAAHLPQIQALFAPPPPPPDFTSAAPVVGPLSIFAAGRAKADAGALYKQALIDFGHNKAAILAAGIPIDVHIACAPYFNDPLAGFRNVGH